MAIVSAKKKAKKKVAKKKPVKITFKKKKAKVSAADRDTKAKAGTKSKLKRTHIVSAESVAAGKKPKGWSHGDKVRMGRKVGTWSTHAHGK